MNFQQALLLVLVAGAAALSSAEPNIEFEIVPRPTVEEDFADYIQYLVEVAEPRTAGERAADADTQARYRDAWVMDSLFVGGPGFPAGFPRIRTAWYRVLTGNRV